MEQVKIKLTLPSLNRINTDIKQNLREGIPIEKGVVLTEPFLEKNRALFEQYGDEKNRQSYALYSFG